MLQEPPNKRMPTLSAELMYGKILSIKISLAKSILILFPGSVSPMELDVSISISFTVIIFLSI